MAARMAMIATTIINSIRVKPAAANRLRRAADKPVLPSTERPPSIEKSCFIVFILYWVTSSRQDTRIVPLVELDV